MIQPPSRAKSQPGSSFAKRTLTSRSFAAGCSRSDILKSTKSLKDKLQELDQLIEAHLKELPESKAVMSPKGIGPQTAIATIAVLKQVPLKDANAFVVFRRGEHLVGASVAAGEGQPVESALPLATSLAKAVAGKLK